MAPEMENDVHLSNKKDKMASLPSKMSFRKYKPMYFNIIYLVYCHLAGLYGMYFVFTAAKWQTLLLACFMYIAALIGITAGAHRLWSHKAFKAKLPLEILLIVMSSISYQNTATEWAEDHRVHHKYSDTDADLHNANRGFFYSHIGWLLVKNHPDVKKFSATVDVSDIYSNPVLRFQKKYAIPFIGFCCFLLPTLIPVYFWAETWNTAWHVNMFRYILNLNAILLVNSATHIYSHRPYDKKIYAGQISAVSFASLGEGFHNYHHVFPWDYRAAELGNNSLNLTTKFIDFFAWIGWAYDLKTVSSNVIKQRSLRTGDGTNLWGYEDKDMPEERKGDAEIMYEKKE